MHHNRIPFWILFFLFVNYGICASPTQQPSARKPIWWIRQQQIGSLYDQNEALVKTVHKYQSDIERISHEAQDRIAKAEEETKRIRKQKDALERQRNTIAERWMTEERNNKLMVDSIAKFREEGFRAIKQEKKRKKDIIRHLQDQVDELNLKLELGIQQKNQEIEHLKEQRALQVEVNSRKQDIIHHLQQQLESLKRQKNEEIDDLKTQWEEEKRTIRIGNRLDNNRVHEAMPVVPRQFDWVQ